MEDDSARTLLNIAEKLAEIAPECSVSHCVLGYGNPEHSRMRDVAKLVIRLFQITRLRKLVNGSDIAL